jgi:tetratricopeptide (TPR) repeat protein
VLASLPDLAAAAPLARQLDDEGEGEAAALLRREATRRARGPEELARLRAALLDLARLPASAFVAAYRGARDDDARRAVVARFLAFAPHDRRLLERLLALAAGDAGRVRAVARRIIDDPFADAALVASAAEALRAAGDADASRRAFEEIVERSPRDPWARAFLGDRLRAAGDLDGAAGAYRALAALAPGSAEGTLRAALADAAAGRVDLALRDLGRLARTGGREADPEAARLAGAIAHVVVRDALATADLPEGTAGRLRQHLAELPPPGPEGSVVLVQAAGGGPALTAELARGTGEARDRRAADASAPGVGLWLFDLGADLDGAEVRLARTPGLPPGAPLPVRIVAIPDPAASEIAARTVELPLDGGLVRAHLTASGAVDRVETDPAR